MDYAVVSADDIEAVDLSEALDGMFDPAVRRVQADLGTEKMVVNIWEFESGEEMVHHAHEKQEEVYYVLEGEFKLKLGEASSAETVTADEGTGFAVGPETGHGHRCISEEGGRLFAVGAPNVTDINPETYTPFDEV